LHGRHVGGDGETAFLETVCTLLVLDQITRHGGGEAVVALEKVLIIIVVAEGVPVHGQRFTALHGGHRRETWSEWCGEGMEVKEIVELNRTGCNVCYFFIIFVIITITSTSNIF